MLARRLLATRGRESEDTDEAQGEKKCKAKTLTTRVCAQWVSQGGLRTERRTPAPEDICTRPHGRWAESDAVDPPVSQCIRLAEMEEDEEETGCASLDECDVLGDRVTSCPPMTAGTASDPGALSALTRLALTPGTAGLFGCTAAESVWFRRCGPCFMHACEATHCAAQMSVFDFRVAQLRASGLGDGVPDYRVVCPSCAAALEDRCSAGSCL